MPFKMHKIIVFPEKNVYLPNLKFSEPLPETFIFLFGLIIICLDKNGSIFPYSVPFAVLLIGRVSDFKWLPIANLSLCLVHVTSRLLETRPQRSDSVGRA